MNGIDGTITLHAREGGARWPANAICDLSVVSALCPSAAVYMTQRDVEALIARLQEQLGRSGE